MNTSNILKSRVLAVLLTIVALAVGQSAWAQTFTIEASHNNSTNKTTFTITRSGSSLPQQTINYRTVNLSAYAGQHYTAVKDTYTFPANETTKTVEVSESTPGTDAYKYQNSTTRSYRFEVLDVNGFELKHYDRTYDIGIQFSNSKVSQSVSNLVTFSGSSFSSGMSSSKYLDVSFTPPTSYVEANNNNSLEGYVLIDDSYDYANKPAVVSTSTLINSTNASASYLKALGYKIYATVCFTEKERDDGYQYVQIVAGTSTHSYDGADGNGKIDNGPTNSVYKACFELSNNTNATGKAYFPHRGTGTDEFSISTGKLWQQKYQSDSYDGSGSVILDPDVANITTRFDAAGDNDDTWGYKDFFVRMALCDATNPTLLNNSTSGITVSGGPYIKGNTFYISVPFSEIVHISGASKQLETSWGPVTYESGDYTNVITYKGTITADAGTVLKITKINNSLFNDLTSNYYQGSDNSFNKTFSGVTCSATYTLTPTNTSFTGLESEYVVSDAAIEPHPTVYFYKGIVNTSNRVTLAETTNYTLAWADNTAAGNGSVTATGTGSYTGSASTTFPIRWATYTVRFHSNYDTDVTSDQAFTYATAQNLNSPFTRTGYTFAHWTTNADGSGTSYTDGQEVLNLTTTDGAVIDLYAQWTAITYNLTYDLAGGAVETSNPPTYNIETETFTLANPTRTGYHFDGWTGSNGTTPETTVTIANHSHGDKSYTANWTAHTYTVRLHQNDGPSGNNATSDQSFTYDTAQNLTADVFSRTGYTFAEWTTNADGSGDSYTDGQSVSNLTPDDGATVNLYAQWTAHTYTVRFHQNDGPSGNNATSDQTLTYDTAQNLTANAFSRTGHIFSGWNTAADGSGDSYTDTQEVSNLTAENGVTVTLYAQWIDVWGITNGADGTSEAKAYIITTPAGLDLLAKMVNGTDGYTKNDFSNKYFKLDNDITYTHTTDWNDATSTENNYTAIGGYGHNFKGVFDGDGHTVSGIRIYKGGSDTQVDGYQGLFGKTYFGTVKNVTLTDARITGYIDVGGIIAQRSYGQVENCHVTNTVAIHAVVNNSTYHGGIVGYNICTSSTNISRCTSAATISIADGLTGCNYYGGIAGQNDQGSIENCLAIGATVSGNSNVAAIVGCDYDGTYTSNYYHSCTVNGTANATSVGVGSQDNGPQTPYDCDGARSVHALTLGTDITASGESVTIGSDTYYASNTTVTLSYGGTPASGYSHSGYSYQLNTELVTLTTNTLTMPAADITVSATFTPITYNITYDLAGGSLPSGQSNPASYTVESADFTLVNPTREGYLFIGWTGGVNSELSTPTSELTIAQGSTGDLSYTAHWHEYVTYIDADGNTQTCTDFTLIESSDDDFTRLGADGATRWYVVDGNVTLHMLKFLDSHSHLILMDGATLTASSPWEAIYASNGALTIYGQAAGTGTLNATSSSEYGISASGYLLTINGGIINASSSGYHGIYANNLVINGGSVNASSGNANCFGILTPGDITLGWRNLSDRIYATSYSNNYGSVIVKAGQHFTDGTAVYDGTLASEQVTALAGQTLQPCFAITLPEHVTATGVISQTGTTAYALADATVTLAVATGYTLTNVTVGSDAATDNGDGTYTFTMPASDATVSVSLAVPYIDANGDEQTCSDYTLLESSSGSTVTLGTAGTESWYVVNGNVNITSGTNTYGAVHLILMDGATLTVEGSHPIDGSGSLSIYGQSGGTGSLVANSSGTGISVNNSITINGGNVTASSSFMFGYGITTISGDITINGGTVNATGGERQLGIGAGGILTLGWRNTSDRIYASRYQGGNGIVVKSGQAFTDGTNIYAGTLTDTQASAIAGKTLQPCFCLTLPNDVTATGTGVINQNGNCYAVPDATVTLSYSAPDGYVVSYSYNDGSDHAITGNTFTMPACDVTVNTSFRLSVSYIDADGNSQTATATLLTGAETTLGTDDETTWYVANSDISFDHEVTLKGDICLILADDKTMTMTETETDANKMCIWGEYNLTIYGQSGGTGALTMTNENGATLEAGNLTINGGHITATAKYDAISAKNSITINGGVINATSQSQDGISTYYLGNLIINGGQVEATSIIATNGNVTLGYRNATDYITIGSRGCSAQGGHYLRIATGKTMTNGTAAYAGSLNDDLTGKTLRPCFSLTLPNGVTASGTGIINQSNNCYAVPNATVTLRYGTVTTGYVVVYSYNDGTEHAITGNTFTMPASSASVSATLTDVWGISGGADGSEAHPYIITTTTGLDLLATCVNDNTASGFSSNGFTGKFFKLGANITYDNENDNLDNTENNYTAIGSSNNRNFRGTFDGDGHTIRGIRIYKGEDNSSSNNQGLFGYVSGGTVKNVTLKEARITGRNQVGGIVGYLRNYSTTQTSTIDNCHVDGTVIIRAVVNSANYHGGIVGNNYDGTVSNCTSGANLLVADGVTDCSFYGGIAGCNDKGATISHCLVSYCSIPDVSSKGAIAGHNYGSSSGDGILTANYYSDCIVGGKTTDVGCNGRDLDGARSVHQLNMGAYTTATGETIDIDGITYYAAGTTVTLSCTATLPEGFIFHGYQVNSTLISGNTFTMPAEQSRAAAYFLPDADTYLGGGDGTENNPYIITTVAGLNLVSKAVSLDCYPAGTHFRLGADIAYDPNTLTIDNDGDGVAESNYTPIGYARPFEGCFDGQGHTVSGIRSIHTSCGLFGQLTHADGYIKNVTVADAVFIATYSTYAGAIAAFNNQGLIENCRAVGVDITCSNTFTGAIVGLTTDGLLNHNYYFDCTVTKSGTTSATNIGTGMCLVEGSQTPVYGDVTTRTYGGITYTDCAVEGVALADNADNTTVISNNTGTGKNVMLYGRTLWKDGAWNTLCLPFDLTLSGSVLDGADVRELVSATITNGTLRLGFTTEGAVTQLTAGTPYIIKWASGDNLVNPLFENVTVTSATNDFVSGGVSFKGTYEPITFDADNHNILFMGDSNTLYWPKSGAHINAFRAYFQLADGSSANNFVLSFDDDEPTMVNGQWGAEGVSVNDNDEWFTLGGVKLNGAPKTKGIYIHNGKKVVIK